jgi:hypothetical protein
LSLSTVLSFGPEVEDAVRQIASATNVAENPILGARILRMIR